GVTTIGSDAFFECTSLASVELSTALKKIGGSAFAKCPSLRVVKCNSPAAPSVSNSTFKNSPCTIYVPKGCSSIYRAHKDWKKITNIREQ
ncbi:MAG: leucine-rich repeat protein, partial [Prevotella sp.]|nr:leucine-rich repeat protein [Prevotella sp.]